MQVSINSKVCESPTNSVPLIVCVIQPAFVIQFSISLQTHNFIFVSVSFCSKYNECTFAKKSYVVVLLSTCVCISRPISGSSSVENLILKCAPFPQMS